MSTENRARRWRSYAAAASACLVLAACTVDTNSPTGVASPQESEATITIGEDARLIGSGTIGLYATAAADASGTAKSKYFSVAYGEAKSTSTVDIKAGALVDPKIYAGLYFAARRLAEEP